MSGSSQNCRNQMWEAVAMVVPALAVLVLQRCGYLRNSATPASTALCPNARKANNRLQTVPSELRSCQRASNRVVCSSLRCLARFWGSAWRRGSARRNLPHRRRRRNSRSVWSNHHRLGQALAPSMRRMFCRDRKCRKGEQASGPTDFQPDASLRSSQPEAPLHGGHRCRGPP